MQSIIVFFMKQRRKAAKRKGLAAYDSQTTSPFGLNGLGTSESIGSGAQRVFCPNLSV